MSADISVLLEAELLWSLHADVSSCVSPSAPGNFPMISDDLVNSYHLLLCALDLVFTNALMCNARKELLNPSFKGYPQSSTPLTLGVITN